MRMKMAAAAALALALTTIPMTGCGGTAQAADDPNAGDTYSSQTAGDLRKELNAIRAGEWREILKAEGKTPSVDNQDAKTGESGSPSAGASSSTSKDGEKQDSSGSETASGSNATDGGAATTVDTQAPTQETAQTNERKPVWVEDQGHYETQIVDYIWHEPVYEYIGEYYRMSDGFECYDSVTAREYLTTHGVACVETNGNKRKMISNGWDEPVYGQVFVVDIPGHYE